MRYLTDTEKNIVLSLALLAALTIVGFFTYRFFHVPRQVTSVEDSTAMAIEPVVPVDVAPKPVTKPKDSLCDSVPLAVVRDAKFEATAVHRGDRAATVGRFILSNTTPCPIAIAKFSFLMDSSAETPVLENAVLLADGAQFGPTLVLAVTQKSIVFSSKGTAVTIPAFGTVALAVTADVSKFAPLGKNFSLQLDALAGTNKETGEAYAWSYVVTRMRVVSNTLDIQ
jgi:hypothetical protein